MANYTNEEIRYIWLDGFLGLEYKSKCEIIEYIKGDKDLSTALIKSRREIESIIGEKEFSTLLNASTETYIKYLLDNLDKKGITALPICSKRYPQSLLNIPFAPFVLYTKGDLNLFNEQCFSIVGSRKSLPASIKLTEVYAKTLCEAGLTLVTGIAEGVDCTVIKTALNLKKKVISVIAGGFDNIYPKINANLLEEVAKSGLVISEYPPETQPKPFHFPIRNRIIAGLGKGVLVVSASKKSGTMYTAEYAIDYGKDLFAIPYSVGVQSGVGCNDLIKKGALLTDCPEDILEFYGLSAEKEEAIELNEQEKEIIEVLSNGNVHVEKICQILGKRVFEIMPTLSILEIKGLVIKSGNVYGLISNISED